MQIFEFRQRRSILTMNAAQYAAIIHQKFNKVIIIFETAYCSILTPALRWVYCLRARLIPWLVMAGSH